MKMEEVIMEAAILADEAAEEAVPVRAVPAPALVREAEERGAVRKIFIKLRNLPTPAWTGRRS